MSMGGMQTSAALNKFDMSLETDPFSKYAVKRKHELKEATNAPEEL